MGKIGDVIEIKVKAHLIKVGVYANIYDAEEYDRLDRESVALHGRKIGREWERRDNNEPGPVRIVTDKEYCDEVKAAATRRLLHAEEQEAARSHEIVHDVVDDGGFFTEEQDDLEMDE